MASGWLAGLAGGLGSLGQHFAMLGQRQYEDRLRQEQQAREDARRQEDLAFRDRQFQQQLEQARIAKEQADRAFGFQQSQAAAQVAGDLPQGADISGLREFLEGSPFAAYGRARPSLSIGADQPGVLLGAPVWGEAYTRQELAGDTLRQLQEDLQRFSLTSGQAREGREAETFGQKQDALDTLPESVRPFATLGMSPFDAMTPTEQNQHAANRARMIAEATSSVPSRTSGGAGNLGRDSDDWRSNYNAEYQRQYNRLKDELSPYGIPQNPRTFTADLAAADQKAREMAEAFADAQLQRFGGAGAGGPAAPSPTAPSPVESVNGELNVFQVQADPIWQQVKGMIDDARAAGQSEQDILANMAEFLANQPPTITNAVRSYLGLPSAR